MSLVALQRVGKLFYQACVTVGCRHLFLLNFTNRFFWQSLLCILFCSRVIGGPVLSDFLSTILDLHIQHSHTSLLHRRCDTSMLTSRRDDVTQPESHSGSDVKFRVISTSSDELLESEKRMGRFDDLTQESHQGDESRTSAISNRTWTRLSRGLSIAAAIWNVGNTSSTAQGGGGSFKNRKL